MDSQFYIELAAIIVSVIALLISFLSFKESKRARIELGQAYLSMELVHTSEGLYAMLRNIGNTYAYDVKVSASKDFLNGFENLSIIQSDHIYCFLLLNRQNISLYPESVIFTIKYHDYYSQKHYIIKEFKFKIMDYLKYDVEYIKDFNCYNIKKSF